MPTSQQSNYCFALIAALLLASALLKSWMLTSDPFSDLRTGFPIGILGVAIVIEFIVTYCLISRRVSVAAKWTLSSTLFLIFLAVSVVRFTLGFRTCGCFGVLEVPQWTSLAVTLSALTLLAVSCGPRQIMETYRSGSSEIQAWLAPRQLEILSGSLVLLLFAGMTYQPVKEEITQLFFQRPVAASPVLLDDIKLGESHYGKAVLTNTSTSPISVVGAEKSCGCIALDVGRTVIEPGESVTLSFLITPKEVGSFHHRLIYFLDSQQQQRVGVEILGYCKEIENEIAKN